MQATAEREKLRLVLDAKAFDQLAKAFLGDKRDYEIGQLFGYDDSEWSLYKTGKRYANTHILAICMRLFPGVLTSTYTRTVPFQPRGSR